MKKEAAGPHCYYIAIRSPILRDIEELAEKINESLTLFGLRERASILYTIGAIKFTSDKPLPVRTSNELKNRMEDEYNKHMKKILAAKGLKKLAHQFIVLDWIDKKAYDGIMAKMPPKV